MAGMVMKRQCVGVRYKVMKFIDIVADAGRITKFDNNLY